MADLTLKAILMGDDRSMSKSFNSAGKASEGLFGKMVKMGGGLVVGAAAAGVALDGITALGGAFVTGVKDAAAYQTLAQKTAQVLKSTGNVAHQSVKGIQARAAALESLSGVDETTIINGQNVLATFTQIRDGVGKGNDIFNQATTAALNMSSALGQDMQSSVVQLGKALNNPIKGITALSRVGVSFTAQQKKQIKTLVDSGHTMEAQKVILRELNTEFGGAAKAAGQGFEGSMARAKDAVQDAFRAIGMKLLPVLTKVADYIATHVGPIIDGLGRVFGNMWRHVAPVLSDMKEAFQFGDDWEAHNPLETFAKGARKVVDFITGSVIPAIKAFGGWVKGDLWPALVKGYKTIMPGLKEALRILGETFKGSGSSGKTFGSFMKGLGSIIVNYVIPIVAKLIQVWLPMLAREWQVIIGILKIVFTVVKSLTMFWGNAIRFVLDRVSSLMSLWATMLRALSHVPGFGWAKDAADKMQHAADKAANLSRVIDNIQRTVVIGVTFKATSGRIQVGGQSVNVGMRASGGPVRRGMPYIVGENEAELFVPNQSGHIYNGRQLAGAGGSSQPLVVQVAVDGKVLAESMLRLKRNRGGMNLGLA